MYVVRDKHTKSVIHISNNVPSRRLSEREVYPHFDPNSMEIGRLPEGMRKVPKHFDIDAEGSVVAVTKRRVDRVRSHALVPPIVAPGVDLPKMLRPKAAGAVAQRRERAAEEKRAEIEAEIARKYTPGQELRILKGYAEWIEDGKPRKDPRRSDYRTMERAIGRIRKKFKKTESGNHHVTKNA